MSPSSRSARNGECSASPWAAVVASRMAFENGRVRSVGSVLVGIAGLALHMDSGIG
jgi:hypothetical protein